MDLITSKLNRKIKFLSESNKGSDLKLYQQVRVEFLLIYFLAYLWNKNLHNLGFDDKDYVISKIVKPSIGDVVEICRKLDINNELFWSKKLNAAISKYPKFRNEKIGHGYCFEDETNDFINTLNEIYKVILSSKFPIVIEDVDLVYISDLNNDDFTGIRYSSNGSDYFPWSYNKKAFDFQVGSLYGCYNNYNYFRLSPFIEIEDENEIYLYSSIQERLLGQVKYNKLFRVGQKLKEWEDLRSLPIETDNLKRISRNKTILNIFENNFTKYIPLEVKNKVKKFLLENKASVCATLWGHGGVGKTATIQSLCEDLSIAENKYFDYIIFLTAKDRSYNYLTGEINSLNEKIDTFDDIVKSINNLLFGKPSEDSTLISNYDGKLLLVIDDFETFSESEKTKIVDFISTLNTNHHKIIITTRADIRTGDEIPTNELSQEETIKFLLEILKIEAPNINIQNFENEIKNTSVSEKVHQITNGRPLFIFQLAHLYKQRRQFSEIITTNIKSTENAIEFLYGRIYEYLSPNARNLFVALSILVESSEELSNVLEKVQYVLNMEHSEDEFKGAVNELRKLRIIEVKEDNFFSIYSKEIFQIMSDYFNKREESFKLSCKSRLKMVGTNRELDVNHSLLEKANAGRISQTEQEVISGYRTILNRANCPKEVKLNAILNLAAYLFNDRGKKDEAVRVLEEQEVFFANEGKFIKMLAGYLWSFNTNDHKRKAIKKLLEYRSKNGNLKNEMNLELFGLLLVYRSVLTISQRDEIKSQYKYQEISKKYFDDRYKQQKEIFGDIYKQVTSLFGYIKLINLGYLTTSGARGNAVTALFHFSEICIRLNKYELAKEICIYSFKHFPRDSHLQFKNKLRKIYSFMGQNKDVEYIYEKHRRKYYEFTTTQSKDTVTPFADKLQKAIEN